MGSEARRRPKRLAEKLLQIRQMLGLSQTEIIDYLGLGHDIKRENISRFESGTREPDSLIVLAYAQIAGVVVDTLLNDDLNLPANLSTNISKTQKETSTSVAKINFRMDIHSNVGSQISEKDLRDNIESLYLKHFSMKKLKKNEYEIAVPYKNESDLNKQVISNILHNIIDEAARYNCIVRWDAHEQGTSRHW